MSTTADGDIPTACFLGFQACQQHNSEHKPDHCCHFLSHWTPVHFSYIAAGGGGVAAAAAAAVDVLWNAWNAERAGGMERESG